MQAIDFTVVIPLEGRLPSQPINNTVPSPWPDRVELNELADMTV